MQITLWGENGRIRIDRQELQIFLRDATAFPEFRLGWNTKYTTELTKPVWYYLRGEEYSMQIDHFVRCILDRTQSSISSFETAVQTDLVLSKMIQNEKSHMPIDTSDEQTFTSRAPKVPREKKLTSSFKKLVGRR
jgi:hypothetical protein